MKMGTWPENFADYVSLGFARQACLRITNEKELKAALLREEDRARRVAKAEEAMDEPPGLPPVPFWARARRGAFGPGGLWLGGGTGGSVVTGPQGHDWCARTAHPPLSLRLRASA